MRIIYPKPIKKARKYRVVEVGHELLVFFLFLSDMVVVLLSLM